MPRRPGRPRRRAGLAQGVPAGGVHEGGKRPAHDAGRVAPLGLEGPAQRRQGGGELAGPSLVLVAADGGPPRPVGAARGGHQLGQDPAAGDDLEGEAPHRGERHDGGTGTQLWRVEAGQRQHEVEAGPRPESERLHGEGPQAVGLVRRGRLLPLAGAAHELGRAGRQPFPPGQPQGGARRDAHAGERGGHARAGAGQRLGDLWRGSGKGVRHRARGSAGAGCAGACRP